ncbi:PepSY-associated TM helix domain-containing protein [Shiella aurantiaca]|nr:PepSY-associated TM helix domain-containing protein [Shiella aurantiaca]
MKKFFGYLHLWLGLISGLVVFIVAITGCIYAFQAEIQEFTQPYRRVEVQEKPLLPPSKLATIADEALPNKHLHAVMYETADRAARAIYYSFEEHYYYFVYINPYTGEVLKVKDEFADFFRWILDGHFYLWLPVEIGQPVVASFTLVFVFMLISGIVLWWPKKSKGVKKKFTLQWSGGWRRKNYDLHSVVGFYICWLGLVFALTGLVWGFEWYRDGMYSLLSGGKAFEAYSHPVSDSTQWQKADIPAIDKVWHKMRAEYPTAAWIEVHPPEFAHASIAANANPDASTYWQIDYRYFDQYTLEELSVSHQWGRLAEASATDKLFRMNYDIHVGAIAGLPGKVLAFLASLTIASLPVTGTLLWWGRRNKKNKKVPKKQKSIGKQKAPAQELVEV